MIVTPAEVKHVLGIEIGDTSEDANLTRLIEAATTWLEGETHRRFQEPAATKEYHRGKDERELYLFGHLDTTSQTAIDSLRVFRRSMWTADRTWEELTEDEDWERRDQTLISLGPYSVWSRHDEIRVDYMDGWVSAPQDIREVIIEWVVGQYVADAATAGGTAGITSEHIGDYSYTVDLGAVTKAGGSGNLSADSLSTVNRYQRKFA